MKIYYVRYILVLCVWFFVIDGTFDKWIGVENTTGSSLYIMYVSDDGCRSEYIRPSERVRIGRRFILARRSALHRMWYRSESHHPWQEINTPFPRLVLHRVAYAVIKNDGFSGWRCMRS